MSAINAIAKNVIGVGSVAVSDGQIFRKFIEET
jgi:hypothetical protein